jgi:hypothetical protein
VNGGQSFWDALRRSGEQKANLGRSRCRRQALLHFGVRAHDAAMPDVSHAREGQQLGLLDALPAPAAVTGAANLKPVARPPSRDRVSVDLRGLGDRLREQAARRQATPAALVRHAVRSMLDEESRPGRPSGIALVAASPGRIVKVTVRMDAAKAASLADRARAVDLAQGDYVAALLDGMPPAALAPDHGAAVAALVASTDRLATLSTDLTVFMRLLGRASVAQLEPYRASVTSLAKDVRQHLATSAALVAELRPARRRQ